MGLKWLRSRTVKVLAVATFSLVALGGLVVGAEDASAAALHRVDRGRVACLRQFLGGSKVRESLDQLVQDGTLTPAQEQAVLDKLIGQMTGTRTCTGVGLMRDHSVGDAVAKLLGMDRSEIKQAWVNGQSLTEIAQSKGVSRDKLVSTIDDAIDAKLQKAVDNGRITAERKTEIMTNVKPIVEKAVDMHRGDNAPAKNATPVVPATPAATSGNIATL